MLFRSRLFGDPATTRYWTGVFNSTHAGEVDTWDYQLLFGNFLHGTLAAIPEQNLVTNVGFGAGATHTHSANDPFANMQALPLPFPLRHPAKVDANREADRFLQRTCFTPSFRERLAYRVRKLLRALG